MKKIDFLAASLRHGLKCERTFHFNSRTALEAGHKKALVDLNYHNAALLVGNQSSALTPVVRRLKDLTVPCVQADYNNGEPFVPVVEVMGLRDNGDWLLLLNKIDFEALPTYISQLLVRWHFDVAGLIEKGEALDVNTLHENPYK